VKITSRLILAEDKLKKGFQKVTLKMVLPAGEAKNNAVLGPLLGQHQINIVSFCNEFNAKSLALFEMGVFLPVFVSLKKDKTYSLSINRPSLSFFLFQIVEVDGFSFKLEKLFDVVKILSFFLNQSENSTARLVFGYMSSFLVRKTIKILNK